MLAGRGAVYTSKEAASRVVGQGRPVSASFTADGKRKPGGQAKGVKPRGKAPLGSSYHSHCHCTVEEAAVDFPPDYVDRKHRSGHVFTLEEKRALTEMLDAGITPTRELLDAQLGIRKDRGSEWARQREEVARKLAATAQPATDGAGGQVPPRKPPTGAPPYGDSHGESKPIQISGIKVGPPSAAAPIRYGGTPSLPMVLSPENDRWLYFREQNGKPKPAHEARNNISLGEWLMRNTSGDYRAVSEYEVDHVRSADLAEVTSQITVEGKTASADARVVTVMRAAKDARGQSRNGLVDLRGTALGQAEAEEIIRRVIGACGADYDSLCLILDGIHVYWTCE